MATVDLVAGTRCLFQGRIVCLRKVLDLKTAIAEYEDTGALVSLLIRELQPVTVLAEPARDTFLSVSDAAYAKAQRKLNILQPLLNNEPTIALITETARTHGVGVSTLRRWLYIYRRNGSVLALVEKERTGGRGVSRLAPEVEAIVQQAISEHFLTAQRKSPTHVLEEVKRLCRTAGLRPPADQSLRLRLNRIAAEVQDRHRLGERAVKERFTPLKSNTLAAPHPLAVVQLDHALINIVLVHEETRQPMSRPWLTIATDVFSRMVVGMYLAFEEPGAGGTGLCLAHSILPKETWLSRRDIKGEWPCWGVMEALHLDNAKEFHGEMLQRASERYGIRLIYRPPLRPEYGGQVERLIRTIKFQVRRLSGAMIAYPRGRRRFGIVRKATFSLPEFEQWLATYLINVYHQRVHSALGVSPFERYQQGIFGSPDQPGIGLRPRHHDELQVRLDFMPLVERSIQRYGVLIDRFHYYADVLRPFIDSREEEAGSGRRARRRFIFKRDPRDLSSVYFLHPVTQQYHPIPLANMARPAISLWEQREIVRRELAHNPDRKRITEDLIFNGLARLEAIEKEAARRTGKMTKAARRMLEVIPKTTGSVNTMIIQHGGTMHNVVHAQPVPVVPNLPPLPPLALPTVEPFEDLDDGTSDLRRSQMAQRAERGSHHRPK
jgi:putative transposase